MKHIFPQIKKRLKIQTSSKSKLDKSIHSTPTITPKSWGKPLHLQQIGDSKFKNQLNADLIDY